MADIITPDFLKPKPLKTLTLDEVLTCGFPDVVEMSREQFEDLHALAFHMHQQAALMLAMLHEISEGDDTA